jgi:hypothetical protein
MDIFGVAVPLWAVFLIGIIAVIAVWKLFKFAIKILLIIIVFFAILIGLDYFQIFDGIQELLSSVFLV